MMVDCSVPKCVANKMMDVFVPNDQSPWLWMFVQNLW